MKILSKAEREQVRKAEFRKKIIFVIIMAVVVYIVLYFLLIDTTFKGYKRDESLNHHYDLSKDLIPEPIQKSVPKETFVEKVRGVDVSITKLASYDITGKVEGIKEYNTNYLASVLSMKGTNVIDYISPYDFALSWGELAQNENSNGFVCDESFINAQRGVFYSYTRELAENYSADFIESHFSNNHVITFNNGIRSELKKVKEGQIIRMKGYLVEVNCSNGATWGPSSLSRTDTGLHGCEILYVEDFIIMK